MKITLYSFTLICAVLLSGLSAGLFYAWQVSVIPGTRRVLSMTYLETMQAINRAILNPAFFLVFFGCLILLAISTFQHYQSGATFYLLLGATLTYLIGTFGVTVLGNVPLNDALDVMELAELTAEQAGDFRRHYELKWNRFHLIRTIFSVLSFLLGLLALLNTAQQ